MPRLFKSIFLIFFLLFFFSICIFAEDITITTYYPSPYGVYNTLRLYPNNNAAAGDACTNAGEMFYNQTSNQILFCNGSTNKWQSMAAGGGVTTQNVVTASRAFTTVYQNTTGKPMFITVSVYLPSIVSSICGADSSTVQAKSAAGSPPATVVGTVGTDPSGSGADSGNDDTASLSFFVLPNNYYQLSATGGTMCTPPPSLVSWVEWY